MIDFSEIDMGGGASGGGGGVLGPYLEWKPDGDRTWNIPFNSFCVKGLDSQDLKARQPVDGYMVLDVKNIRVGWSVFAGGRSQWQWSPAGSLKLGERPGPVGVDKNGKPNNWNSGFLLPVLVTINGERIATRWNQTTRGAVTGFERLCKKLFESSAELLGDKYPVVHVTDVETMAGGVQPTAAPLFEIVKIVARPAELEDHDWAGSGDYTPPVSPAVAAQSARIGANVAQHRGGAPRPPTTAQAAAATAAQAPAGGRKNVGFTVGGDAAPGIVDDEIPF